MADQILVLEQKVEEMKSKGWTVVGDKPTPPKPKAKKEIGQCYHRGSVMIKNIVGSG